MYSSPDIRLIVVKNGREWPGCFMLGPGDQIASRHYDQERHCHVVHVLTPGIPPSPEVREAGRWPRAEETYDDA